MIKTETERSRTTNDDGDLVDLEANDENELFLTTSKIAADDNDNEEDGEQQKGELVATIQTHSCY